MPNKKNAPKVTIRDIALESGVSIATVSRAITGKDGMSQQTRERILEIGRRLNYFPNLQARALAGRKPNVIGIIFCQSVDFTFGNPFHLEGIRGIVERAKESGYYTLLLFSGKDSYEKVYQHGLAAGIVVLSNLIDDARIEEAWKMGIPLVLLPGHPELKRIPSVDVNNIEGAFKAVQHLAGLGHRRIAFINGSLNSKYSVERLTGYSRALKKNHLPYKKEFILEAGFTEEDGYKGMKKILSMPKVATAVLAVNDFSAIGAVQAAKEQGYRIPQDISIVGFGDASFASAADPPLTTVHAPYKEVGYEGANMLLRVLNKKRIPERHKILPVELIIRKSTAPPPNAKDENGHGLKVT